MAREYTVHTLLRTSSGIEFLPVNQLDSFQAFSSKAMGSPYSTEKLRDYKPSNCTLVKNSKEEDPYREARRFISEDTKHNWCNVGRDNSVQQWQLPRGQSKVLLKKAAMVDSGTTFYYHDDLLGSEEFPG